MSAGKGLAVANYNDVFTIRRLWLILASALIVMFATLLYFGREIYQLAPPIPAIVVSESGQTIFSREEIQHGQNVWQSMGGMQQGSIWGHGGYLAPDWSADWLHREAIELLDIISRNEQGVEFDALEPREAEWMRVEHFHNRVFSD